MRTLLKFVFGSLFVASVFAGAVYVQLHARELQRKWDPDLARRHDDPIPVRTVNVKEKAVNKVVGGTAVTEASATAIISTVPRNEQIPDRLVSSVPIQEGVEVSKGDTILTFDEDLFEATVIERKVALLKQEKDFEAFTRLREQAGLSARELRAAELEVASAKLQLQLAEYQLEACKITSPLDGLVATVQAVPGMRITSPTELAAIHQLDPIHVIMDYPTDQLDTLEIGQQAEVVLDAFPGEKFSGEVVRMGTTADARTRVLRVTVAVANPDNRIRAGITGFVRIPHKKAEAKTVPGVAVIDKKDKAMVFLVKDGRAKIREIERGATLDQGEVEVLSGLDTGEQVVVFGQDGLRENDLVNVNWREWTHQLLPRQR